MQKSSLSALSRNKQAFTVKVAAGAIPELFRGIWISVAAVNEAAMTFAGQVACRMC